LNLYPAHRSHLPAGDARDCLVHFFNKLGSREQSIMPLVHGSGSGMVGKAFHSYLRVQNPDDTLHHADVDLLLLQSSTLLNVQFEISGDAAWLPLDRSELAEIAAEKPGSFANGLAALGGQVEQLFLQAKADSVASDGATLFILKNNDLQRMAQSYVVLLEDLGHLNGRKGAYIAIIVAAFRDRVDMGADQQRLERRIAARARAHNISGSVNADIKLRLTHQAHGIFAALAVRFAVGHAEIGRASCRERGEVGVGGGG